jgi:hypothetical protein
MRLVLVLLALAAACASPAAPIVDGGSGDAGSADAGDLFTRFAADVDAAVRGAASMHNCAVAVPATPVNSAAAAHEAVRAYVAHVVGVAAVDVQDHALPCSGGLCASHFNHDLYKSDGLLADALTPLAQTVEVMAGATTEEVVWSPVQGDISLPADVSIEGVVEGRVLGIVFFNDRTSCR